MLLLILKAPKTEHSLSLANGSTLVHQSFQEQIISLLAVMLRSRSYESALWAHWPLAYATSRLPALDGLLQLGEGRLLPLIGSGETHQAA
jgi:hypothetical protein